MLGLLHEIPLIPFSCFTLIAFTFMILMNIWNLDFRDQLDHPQEEDWEAGASDQQLQLSEPVERDLLQPRDRQQHHVALQRRHHQPGLHQGFKVRQNKLSCLPLSIKYQPTSICGPRSFLFRDLWTNISHLMTEEEAKGTSRGIQIQVLWLGSPTICHLSHQNCS